MAYRQLENHSSRTLERLTDHRLLENLAPSNLSIYPDPFQSTGLPKTQSYLQATGIIKAFNPLAATSSLRTVAPTITGFSRIQSAPIIANHNQGGGTIGGIQADALAAPSACWDGTRWVMTLSIWTISNSKWSSAFFTSPDLAKWTYVPNSLLQPSIYIIGDAGLAWFGNAYWFAYEYLTAGNVYLAYSTNLTSWTIVGNPLSGVAQQFDIGLVVNPITGLLELWGGETRGGGIANGPYRDIIYATSSDGTHWTDHSGTPVILQPSWVSTTPYSQLGAPQPWYSRGQRFVTCDTVATGSSDRMTSLFYWKGSTVQSVESVLSNNPSNYWESVQVFDACCVGPWDRGDGRGVQLWMLYAGGTNNSAADNTDSCIGLAYMSDPTFPTVSSNPYMATTRLLGANR